MTEPALCTWDSRARPSLCPASGPLCLRISPSSLFSPSYWISVRRIQRFSSASQFRDKTNTIPFPVLFLEITYHSAPLQGRTSPKQGLSRAICPSLCPCALPFTSVSCHFVNQNFAFQSRRWPPFAKSSRHIFINFLRLSKALDKVTLIPLKYTLSGWSWHTSWVSADSLASSLFLLLTPSHQPELYVWVLFRVQSSTSFCYSCIPSPQATSFHPELHLQTSLSLPTLYFQLIISLDLIFVFHSHACLTMPFSYLTGFLNLTIRWTSDFPEVLLLVFPNAWDLYLDCSLSHNSPFWFCKV